jgi:hypothetical protein
MMVMMVVVMIVVNYPNKMLFNFLFIIKVLVPSDSSQQD